MAKRRNRTVMPSKTEGKTPQQNHKAERKPMAKRRNRTVMPSKTEGKAPQQNHKAERKPMTKHRDRNARLDALIPRTPIPNFAFRIPNYPHRSPARTNACAGAKTGRHKRRAGQQFIHTQPHCGRRNSADKRPR